MTKNKPEKRVHDPLRETFAKFFEDPSRDKLHDLIAASGGEFRDLDFKAEWPSKAALAKQVLALGNIGGGLLIVGVKEGGDGSLTPVGVESLVDKAVIVGGIKGILPTALLNAVTVHDFEYPSGDYGVIQGLKFQVMFVIPEEHHLPFLAVREAEKISPGVVYVRRDGMVDPASNEEVQSIINQRIAGGHSSQPQLDLKAHIDQLRLLYKEIQPVEVHGLAKALTGISPAGWLSALGGHAKANPHYPEESFDKFISELIRDKKSLIRRVAGVI